MDFNLADSPLDCECHLTEGGTYLRMYMSKALFPNYLN
ncbi:hypothetical protein BTN49_2835 [Candidatus Enterovibrio escicola]|uniref:Uncharacterized protein n=1 Tax=Candidatus Enterovibrio escicola TaxID=1927127 RepID=A0A2A5T0B7_9GAMM|nr:hypothetical protein BTN49_2835 [Candidatus Enterovibrio escacola]